MTAPAGPVGVISNPGSGHNGDHFQGISARIDGTAGIRHVITHSAGDIPAALQELARRDTRVLAINGGDGTAAAVLGCLLETEPFTTPPLIALLPGGTANMTAGDIGVRGSLRRAVERFCHWCESERPVSGKLARRPLLRVSLAPGQEPHYGMFLGAGAIIQGTEYAHENVHSRGLRDDFSLALITLRTVLGVLRDDPAFNRHVTLQLALDGGTGVRRDTLILAISTLQRLAFGMRPFWGTEDGAVRLTLMEQGCTRFARTFLSIARGRPNRNAVAAQGYHSHNASDISLDMEGKLNLDGEILQAAGPLHISASRPLEFLVL